MALGRDAATGEEEDAEEFRQHFQASTGKVECADHVNVHSRVEEARNAKLTLVLLRN